MSPSYCMCPSLKYVSSYSQETSSAAQTPCPPNASFACGRVYSAMGLFHSALYATLVCVFWGGRIGFICFDSCLMCFFLWPLVKFHYNSPRSYAVLLALGVHRLKDSFSCPCFSRDDKENLTTSVLSIKTPPFYPRMVL